MEILSDLVRKDVTKFNNNFYHFQDANLQMFQRAFNNYSMQKLNFINTYTFAIYCKNVSYQYYTTNQDTKPHTLL